MCQFHLLKFKLVIKRNKKFYCFYVLFLSSPFLSKIQIIVIDFSHTAMLSEISSVHEKET